MNHPHQRTGADGTLTLSRAALGGMVTRFAGMVGCEAVSLEQAFNDS